MKKRGQEDYNPIFSVTAIEASAYVLLGDVTYYLPNKGLGSKKSLATSHISILRKAS